MTDFSRSFNIDIPINGETYSIGNTLEVKGSLELSGSGSLQASSQRRRPAPDRSSSATISYDRNNQLGR